MRHQLLTFAFILLALVSAYAQDNTRANTIYTGTAQPFVSATAPLGAQRGTTVTITIEGANLTGASEVLWNKPGLTSKITFNTETPREMPKLAEGQTGQLVIDKLVRNKLTIETMHLQLPHQNAEGHDESWFVRCHFPARCRRKGNERHVAGRTGN
jgi:hypothetical protein